MTERKRPYHHGNLRETLLELSERLLERDGLDALTLRALARSAQVTHAAAYHHFEDREGLLRALAARGFERFAGVLSEASAGRGPQALLEVGVAYVRFAATHPALFRLMFATLPLHARNDPALREASDRALSVLLDAVRAASPGRGERAVRHQALNAWSMAHGLAGLLLEGHVEHFGLGPLDPERLAREILVAIPGPGGT